MKAIRRAYAQRPGIGVDSSGGQVVDPTKNVEDLVKALEVSNEKLRIADAKRLDDLRDADKQRIDDLRNADQDRLDDLRDAEKARLGEIAALKREYDKQIFDIQTVQVKTTSDLISAQLSKETSSLANQINAATVQNQGLINTLSSRIDTLEKSRYEISGRSSVSDPALASAMAEMASSIQILTRSDTKTDTRREGVANLGSMIVGAAIIVSTVIGAAAFVLGHAH